MRLICINCPKGCQLEVTMTIEGLKTIGHKCPKGLAFAEQEWFNPVRVLTTTVKTTDDKVRRVPVRTTVAIPRDKIMDAMTLLDTVVIVLPIKVGTVVVHDLLNLNVDVIATFTMQPSQGYKGVN